ncbi:MAG: hypothetical protein QOJ91_137 [Sphingomonadales bacterium]|jgi:hypothetical protein|nr:hypothetical protein [Sphingomonadales bacterium]
MPKVRIDGFGGRKRSAKLRGAFAYAVALAGAAAPSGPAFAAPAAPPIGSQAVGLFAGCLAERHHRAVTDYVIHADIPTSALIRAEKSLSDRACVPARSSRAEAKALLNLPQELRSALAEMLVREEFPVFEVAQIGAAQPLDYAKTAERLWPACAGCDPKKQREIEAARARASRLMAPLAFGECAVRTDPADAHRLLLTQVDSPEEAAALRSLQAAFESCVMPDGRLGMTRKAARGLISLNYYRLARSHRVGPAPGGAK